MLAAVVFLGESFSVVNGIGLAVLIAGVALFNWTKYRKMASGQAKGAAPPAFRHEVMNYFSNIMMVIVLMLPIILI